MLVVLMVSVLVRVLVNVLVVLKLSVLAEVLVNVLVVLMVSVVAEVLVSVLIVLIVVVVTEYYFCILHPIHMYKVSLCKYISKELCTHIQGHVLCDTMWTLL